MVDLAASQLSLHYAEIEIFSEVTLQVNEGAHIGIVGPNGSGKTSLIRVLLGDQDFDNGDVYRRENVRIGYVPQTAMQQDTGSIREQVMESFGEIADLEKELENSALEIQQTEGDERRRAERKYSNLVDIYEAKGGYNYLNAIEQVIEGVGLTPQVLDTPLRDASGGERTRAALASALLGEPDILVLDEPTNYLDFKGLEWLENFLLGFSNSYMVVSHDRYFLDKVAKEIWEVDQGRLKTYHGNFSKYRMLRQQEDERLAKEYQKQQDYIRREKDFIARYHAGQRSKEARGRAKRLSRVERISAPISSETVTISSESASRAGQIIISTKNLEVGYSLENEDAELCSVPDSQIEKGTTTAIIGNNGTGKTTLLKTIIGEIPPLSGNSNIGHNVNIGYYRQGSDEIPNYLTVMQALLEIKNMSIGEARSFLARFLFKGDEIFNQVSSLSGGERGRLALARLLITKPNVLVLDEPTTHLDIPSREALESMLFDFSGTIIFVSHDRHLISLLADNIWILANGKVETFDGTYAEWVASISKQPIVVKKKEPRTIELPSKRLTKNRNNSPSRQGNGHDKKIDYEVSISEIESQIIETELKIADASTLENVELIRELGIKHANLNDALEKALDRWIN